MPEVPGAPYEPYPSVEPEVQPLRPIGIPEVPAAFGAATAAATQAFGGKLDMGEVFSRALGLRQMQLESDARQQVAAFNQEYAPLQADFDSLQEGAAREQLQTHLQAVEALRLKYRDGLPLYAQRMYDSELASIQNFAVRSSVGHAQTEYKKSISSAAEARMGLIKKTFVNPQDPAEFKKKIEDLDTAVDDWGQNENKNEDEINLRKLKEESSLRASQLQTIAQKHPDVALKMLDNYAANKLLTQDDQKATQEYVEGKYRSVTSDDLTEKYAGQSGSAEDRVNRMKADIKKDSVAVGIPGYETHAVNSLKSKISNDLWFQRQEEVKNENVIHNAIMLGPRDQADMERDPKVAEAVEYLKGSPDGAKFVQSIPGQINIFNGNRTKEQNDENFRYLMGLGRGNPKEKEQFLNETGDMSKWQLGTGGYSQVLARREAILKNPMQEDARVGRAVQWMKQFHGTELEALNVDRYREAYKDQYYKYIGTLATAVDEWANAHEGQPPSMQEVKDIIGPSVIHTRTDESGLFGRLFGTTRAAFDIDIDPNDQNIMAARANIKKEMEDRGYPDYEVTDQELYNAVQRKQFHNLYGGSGTK
jgi:hypothetical protein